jgi:microcystin-dependent protein
MIDFAGFAIPAGWLECNGASLLRASYPTLHAALDFERVATLTNGSAVVTFHTYPAVDTMDLQAGMPVEGDGIPAGTTILSVDYLNQVTLNQNATKTGIKTLSFFPYGAADATHFNLPDARKRVTAGREPGTSNFTAPGQTGGEEGHTLAIEEVPELWLSEAFESGGASAVTGYTGAATSAHNNLQPYLVVRKIVKT